MTEYYQGKAYPDYEEIVSWNEKEEATELKYLYKRMLGRRATFSIVYYPVATSWKWRWYNISDVEVKEFQIALGHYLLVLQWRGKNCPWQTWD